MVLTAVFRGKLPEVQFLHGEVDKCGQFAGSPRFREAFQIWTRRWVKDKTVQGGIVCKYTETGASYEGSHTYI
jgi:hypothetical protein